MERKENVRRGFMFLRMNYFKKRDDIQVREYRKEEKI